MTNLGTPQPSASYALRILALVALAPALVFVPASGLSQDLPNAEDAPIKQSEVDEKFVYDMLEGSQVYLQPPARFCCIMFQEQLGAVQKISKHFEKFYRLKFADHAASVYWLPDDEIGVVITNRYRPFEYRRDGDRLRLASPTEAHSPIFFYVYDPASDKILALYDGEKKRFDHRSSEQIKGKRSPD